MKRAFVISMALLSLAGAVGCGGPKAVRGSDTPGLDYGAMSTSLDRRDLNQMMRENMQALKSSRAYQQWAGEQRPAISVIPIQNETTEHIDSALGALLSDIETELINSAPVRVISIETQKSLMEEIQRQQHSQGAFDPSQVASWGKQLGARYVVTGRVYSTDERTPNAHRVQYYLFIRVVSVETGEVLFQNQAAVTKAIL